MTDKITELTAIGATPANDDVLPMTDVSDTTQNASGTTKKVTVAELVGSAVNEKTMLYPQDRIPPLSDINAASLSLAETSGATYGVPYFILAFDDSTDEGAWWIFRVPQAFTTATLKGLYYMAGANTSKNVGWVAYLCAVSDTDASFTASAINSANTGTTTCPDAAGTVDEFSVTLTNDDGLDVGDWAAILIRRNAAVASDATGDANLIVGEVSYA